MFTGLIESVGEIVDVTAIEGGCRIGIRSDLSPELREGESVAVNGVCLTVVRAQATDWVAEIGPETTKVTSLGRLKRGSLVNLERAMRPDGRFGGHFVLGHVDGTCAIQAIRPEADFSWVTVSYPGGLAPLLIDRGSVALDGISLTIARLEAKTFDVQIVPFTWMHTNLRAARVGDHVNLECDMVGKYVLRAVEQYVVSGLGRTVEKI
jgi:riboflavin synthase